MKKILIFGSPCTFWSGARKDGRETEPSGLGWDLFQNCVIAKEKFQPDFFLYENNKSINPSIKKAISDAFGVKNMTIDAGYVSAQHREREYWFNWRCPLPDIIDIDMKSVLDDPNDYFINLCSDGKVHTLKAGYYKQGLANFITNGGHAATAVAHKVNEKDCLKQFDEFGNRRRNASNVAYSIFDHYININNNYYPVNKKIPDGWYTIRKLSPEECERIQTLPVGYTDAENSPTNRYKGIGNGWSAKVIEHILSYGLKNIPKDEELVVVSLYDGISTGRYVLEKLGFTNIKYYSYEIDKNAIKISQKNYPDIIQMGDAFDVRKEDWEIK